MILNPSKLSFFFWFISFMKVLKFCWIVGVRQILEARWDPMVQRPMCFLCCGSLARHIRAHAVRTGPGSPVRAGPWAAEAHAVPSMLQDHQAPAATVSKSKLPSDRQISYLSTTNKCRNNDASRKALSAHPPRGFKRVMHGISHAPCTGTTSGCGRSAVRCRRALLRGTG